MNRNWKIFARKLTILEDVYIPKVTAHLKREIKQFVDDLKTYGQAEALSNLQRSVNLDFSPLMDLMHRKGGAMGAKITADELKLSVKNERKAASFGRNARWEAMVLESLRMSGLEFVLDISETSREYILRQFEIGVKDQLTFEQIIQNLIRAEYWEARARRIVRTELVRAANEGHKAAAREFPFEVNKKWSASPDHRTRHAHRAMHGQTIGEDDYFKVPIYQGDKKIGTEDMSAPGDAKATPGNTVNCRCRIVHEAKRDANGNLIERNATSARVIPLRDSNSTEQSIRRAIAASIKMLTD